MNDPLPEHIAARIASYTDEQREIYTLNYNMLVECGHPELAADNAAHGKAMGYDVELTAPRANGKTAAPRYVRHEREARPNEEQLLEWPDPLDLRAMSQRLIPERIYRVGSIMLTGTVGMITGHGGAGKTQFGLHLGACLAADRPFYGETVLSCKVAFISAEDDAEEIHLRLAHQCAHLDVSIADLADRFHIYDVSQSDATLIVENNGTVGPTARYWLLKEELEAHSVQAVIIDNIASTCAGNINDPRYATRALSLLAGLVPRRGNLIALAHVDKALAKAGYGAQAYSGTAAWHNRSRWRWYLYAPNVAEDKEEDGLREDNNDDPLDDDGNRVLEVQKNNAGKIGQRIMLRFVGPRLVPFGTDGIAASIERGSERRWILRQIAKAQDKGDPILAAYKANLNAHVRLTAVGDCPKKLKGKRAKQTLLRTLAQLKEEGLIEEGSIKNASRHPVGVWHITQVGRGEL